MLCVRAIGPVALALAAVATAFLPAPAAADNVLAGSDLFVTAPGTSYDDLSLPAGFFGPGSLPFTGRVYFVGQPIAPSTPLGPTDTVVERLDTATFGCGGSDVVPIEIVALNLVSANPISVDFGSGTSFYSLRVGIDPAVVQTVGSMNITHAHEDGGTFSAILHVQPHFHFTKLSGTSGLPTVELDPPSIEFQSGGHWLHATPAPFVSPTLGVPLVVPNPDADLGAYTINPTSNFAPGYRKFEDGGSDCAPDPMCTYGKSLTCEEAALARHGILPGQTASLQEGVTLLPDGSCIVTTQAIASNPSCPRVYCGNGTTPKCESCNCGGPPPPGLPASSNWSLALALALLALLTAWWLRRVRRGAA